MFGVDFPGSGENVRRTKGARRRKRRSNFVTLSANKIHPAPIPLALTKSTTPLMCLSKKREEVSNETSSLFCPLVYLVFSFLPYSF